MKQAIFTLPVGIPIALAAGRKPPVARTQLPKFVRLSRSARMIAIPANHRTEARISPPSSMKPTNSQLGTSPGRMRGGNPPETTMVIDRAMNSIPSVVMKEGISKRIVIQPFTNPMNAHSASPAKTAGQNGQPLTKRTAIVIGISAKTDPTERSNSPQIIRSVTPSATSAVSGRRPNIPRRLLVDRNTPSDRTSNRITSSTSRSSPASSGFSSAIFKRRRMRVSNLLLKGRPARWSAPARGYAQRRPCSESSRTAGTSAG